MSEVVKNTGESSISEAQVERCEPAWRTLNAA
jgi:hypothetical protein